MEKYGIDLNRSDVAPFAGAWIEMFTDWFNWDNVSVAPFAGAWIEIRHTHRDSSFLCRRSLRGSVD